jgi:hypothetical protein
MLPLYKVTSSQKDPKEFGAITIKKIFAWGFFDDAYQGPDKDYVLGFKLHFSNAH